MVDGNVIVDSRGWRSCATCYRERHTKYQRKWRAARKESEQSGGAWCHHRWAQHVCIQAAGHNRADHLCPCGDTWAVSVTAPSG
jgi:hypothetical protein